MHYSADSAYSEVKVIIDGYECRVAVPIADYDKLKEGDKIILDYYGGALNFTYYSYYGIA